ncbi:MAG: PIG-L deacetylase family protein [Gaiellales bacterium]
MPELGLPSPLPQRVLAVGAHPDDCDAALGGTLALLADLGAEIAYAVVTDGTAGGWDPDLPREEIEALRVSEQEAAAAVLGVGRIYWLRRPDGAVFDTVDLRRDLARVIRETRPDVVATHSPERNRASIAASHPDHLAVGAATLAAVYPDARNRFQHAQLLADGLEPFAVPQVWLYGDPHPTRVVDVTDAAERKARALRAHASQNPPGAGLAEALAARDAATALAFGFETGHYAETFAVLDTR